MGVQHAQPSARGDRSAVVQATRLPRHCPQRSRLSTLYPPRKARQRGRGEGAGEKGRRGLRSSTSPAVFPGGLMESFAFKEEAGGGPSATKRARSEVKKEEGEDGVEEARETLAEVPDHVRQGMDILFIGSNPGRMSSQRCQHFAHPSNHFYRALHHSGLTPNKVSPCEDYTLLDQSKPYLSLGLTNLVARPTRMAQDVHKSEEAVGAETLLALIRRHRPRLGVFVGMGVARSFERCMGQVKHEDGEASVSIDNRVPLADNCELGYGVGLLRTAVRHSTGFTLLYAMPSTSGRVTTHQLKEKTECMAWARVLASQLGSEDGGGNSGEGAQRRLVRIQLV